MTCKFALNTNLNFVLNRTNDGTFQTARTQSDRQTNKQIRPSTVAECEGVGAVALRHDRWCEPPVQFLRLGKTNRLIDRKIEIFNVAGTVRLFESCWLYSAGMTGVRCGGGGGSNIATRGFANSNYDNPLGETIITIIDGGSEVWRH